MRTTIKIEVENTIKLQGTLINNLGNKLIFRNNKRLNTY